MTTFRRWTRRGECQTFADRFRRVGGEESANWRGVNFACKLGYADGEEKGMKRYKPLWDSFRAKSMPQFKFTRTLRSVISPKPEEEGGYVSGSARDVKVAGEKILICLSTQGDARW